MTRVTMPSRDSLGSVDPDDVQVAKVDTLFIHQGRARAALGAAAGPPGGTGEGLLSSVIGPGAELGTQNSWGEKEQVSGDVSSEARGTLDHRIDIGCSRPNKSRGSIQPAFSKKHGGKGLFTLSLLNMTSPLPPLPYQLQRDYTRAEETTTWRGTYQPP